ncbi:hypothetical protein C6P40_002101 [Pichia californica]|uniref:DUF2428 domain-containing protein n=1 Tax=Pichia californica TaxID=460514 RepID=A0A9P6WK67_9ASCO|nr:hypothetical protein C6P42_002152 [[Candida] californica]KAG0687607.1 hypothetical protein C6P40_002101 [[Candida] californica]
MEKDELEIQLLELKEKVLKSKTLDYEAQLETLHSTFEQIYNAVIANKVSVNYRTIASDTLSVWFTRSLQLFNKNKNKNLECKTYLQNLLTQEKATFIFHYVIDFWSDSGAALGNALKELFIKMLSFLLSTLDLNISNELFTKWLKTALDLPYTMRALYFMIEHLHKYVKPVDFVLINKNNFISDSISNIWSRALGSVVGKSVYMILKYNYDKNNETYWLSLWQYQIINGLHDINLRKGIESYILPNLFQISKTATLSFLKTVIKENNIPILLSTLKVAQDNAILIEPFSEIDPTTNKPLIDIEDICSLLKVETASYRIGAFQLLVSSPKLAKLIPSVVYSSVFDSLDMIFMDGDLETRNEIFSYFKRFITRIKDSTYALHRDSTSLTKKNYEKFELEIKDKLNSIEESRIFINDLLHYIKFNLRPGSSYLKKEMSYKLLLVLIKSGLDSRISNQFIENSKTVGYVYSVDIYDSLLIRLVIDNMLDNFEDIRSYSTEIISMAPLSLDNYIDMNLLESRSLNMLSDIKGKDVDSGARFFKFSFNYYQNINDILKCESIITLLLNKIDLSLIKLKEDISVACISYSIQGYFAAFKFIFEIMDFKKCENILLKHDVIDKLINQSIDVWNNVKKIVQHDSPEGIQLEEFQSKYTTKQEELYGKGTQVISSYAWRSIKESSNMVDSLLKFNSPITNKNIMTIGPLLLEQLATIRHRGAFSSVYPTFISCCKLCTIRKELTNVPSQWLEENLTLIQTRSKFITRRSAGIPFLLTAILSSDKKLVKPTFYKLIEVANLSVDELDADMDNMNLPQVNAFNCIKAIFIDASLSEESILYVDDAFSLTLNSFASPYWAIRNCAVMLFTALQNRLFSSKKVKANYLPSYPARLFFEKFESIHELFFTVLNESISKGLKNQTEVEKIFPILTVMSRLEPTPGYTGLNEFIPLIIDILENKIWKVREMAARSLPSMIGNEESFKYTINKLLANVISNSKNFNMIHGSLLAIREIILKFMALSSEDSNNSIDLLINNSDSKLKSYLLSKTCIILEDINCYSVKMTYLQILKILKIDDKEVISQIFKWFNANNNLSNSLNGSKQLALKEACELLLNNMNNNNDLISGCMFSPLYELQLICIKYYDEEKKINNDTIELLINYIWKLLEIKDVWKYVKSQALKLLKRLIIKSEKNDSLTNMIEHTTKLMELLKTEINEDIKLSVIEALGSYISKLLVNDSKLYQSLFFDYVKYIQGMITDDMEFIVRMAALKSLIAFNEIYNSFGDNEKIKLTVTGFIFEFLTDDDEAACRLSAKHLSKFVLNKGDIEYVPIDIEKLMIEYFYSKTNNDLTNCFINGNGFNFYDKETKFENIIINDLLLFSSEKSNLDRNPVDKAKELIQIIENTQLHKNINALLPLINSLNKNIEDITTYLNQHDEIDGCFGLFSTEKVFDFVYTLVLLSGSLKKYGIEINDIELIKILKVKKMKCHPLILSCI